MCFSEKLTEKAAGYQEKYGYVMVGYKVVFSAGGILMPWWALQDKILAESLDYVELRQRTDYRHSREVHIANLRMMMMTKFLVSVFEEVRTPIFTPRRLHLADPNEHPYHVAATYNHAVKNGAANPFGCSCIRKPLVPVADWKGVEDATKPTLEEIKYEEEYVPHPPGAVVRVLVPQAAIMACNHVKAMMIIPPRERETPQDIAACDRYNRNMRSLEERPQTSFKQWSYDVDSRQNGATSGSKPTPQRRQPAGSNAQGGP